MVTRFSTESWFQAEVGVSEQSSLEALVNVMDLVLTMEEMAVRL
jgi:hypothetical protein